jgi:hypothetical protein
MKNKVILFLVSFILGAILMLMYGCDSKSPPAKTYTPTKKAYKAPMPTAKKPVYQAPKVAPTVNRTYVPKTITIRPVYTPTQPKSTTPYVSAKKPFVSKPRPAYPAAKTFKSKGVYGKKSF